MNARTIIGLLLLSIWACQPAESPPLPEAETSVTFDLAEANRLSELAFHCIDREYPNKLGQVLGDSSYLAEPSDLHPVFYGCFDWHSAVHGHWSLVYLLKAFPDLPLRDSIRLKIDGNITTENVHAEVQYFDDEHNKNFERTYGWAWLLKLVEELDSWDDPDGRRWREALRPLEDLIVSRYFEFLPKLTYPIRVGEHTNTAFGISFAWDYARTTNNAALQQLIESRAQDYYAEDVNCPLSWEPSGFDFLSPCLEEIDMMSRVLSDDEFHTWFSAFAPAIEAIEPAEVSDRSDGKLVHLDGLNFSRAWVLYTIAPKLPKQKSALIKLADQHVNYSLSKMQGSDYAGGHWLASFALYALSRRADIYSIE